MLITKHHSFAVLLKLIITLLYLYMFLCTKTPLLLCTGSPCTDWGCHAR